MTPLESGQSRDYERQYMAAMGTVARLSSENQRLRALLDRIDQWDVMYTMSDGPYWRAEIAAALTGDEAP